MVKISSSPINSAMARCTITTRSMRNSVVWSNAETSASMRETNPATSWATASVLRACFRPGCSWVCQYP